MPMQLHQLRYFLAVADKGSFSKGALLVGVAQSAVSLQIRRLEESLDVELFDRTTRGAALTPAGLRLREYATAILDQVALAETMVPQRDGVRKIAIRLGVPSGIAQLLSVPLLKDIAEALPGIDLKIVEALSGDLQDQLAEGRLDMALLFQIRKEEDPLNSASESVYLVEAVRDGTPLGTSISLADLAGIPLTLPTTRHQIRQFLTELAGRQGISLNIRAELDGHARILQLVISGQATSVMLASSFLREWHANQVTAHLIVDFQVEPVVVLSKSRKVTASRAVEAVRRRVEMLARAVSVESAQLSPAFLNNP